MRHAPATLPLAAALLAAVACADDTPVAPRADEAPLAQATSIRTPSDGPWARIVEGETGPGALYALYLPRRWNGDAVSYAHGVRAPLAPITLDDQDNFFEVRDSLGALGYAFAYSSFSENGLAIKDGAQRTHQLRGLLAAATGSKPRRHFLAGYSLGALVALELAERYAGQYDGILAACGMVGGTPLQVQYVGDVRALFDWFYPGVLPGDVNDVPASPPTREQVAALIGPAIAANPMGLYAIASTAQTPLAYAPVGSVADPTSTAFETLTTSLGTALYYQLLATNDVRAHTHGHAPYANRDTVYRLGVPVLPYAAPYLAQLVAQANAGVKRYDSPPDARNYLAKHYQPTGRLRIPLVTVHNLWDPLVPFMHEAALDSAMAHAGTRDMLLPRGVLDYGHCNFPTPLVVGAFGTLATWVETGSRPAP